MTDTIKRSPTTEWAWKLVEEILPQLCVASWDAIGNHLKERWVRKFLDGNPLQPKWIRIKKTSSWLLICNGRIVGIARDFFWCVYLNDDYVEGDADSLDAAKTAVEEAVMERLREKHEQ